MEQAMSNRLIHMDIMKSFLIICVVIGAGSVITKDIPDNSVVVGNPARIIGSYDEQVMKNKLLFEEYPIWHTHYSQKSDREKQEMKATLLRSGWGFDK